jgi:transposase
MQLKTILNRVQRHGSFVYEAVRFVETVGQPWLEVTLKARANSRPRCSGCGRRRPGYDTLGPRRFEFVPLWGIQVYFVYAPRRVDCPRCGVHVEALPWAVGKHRLTTAYAWFLARWARRLSWKEVAEVFRISWDQVFRAVEMAVEWGREHRDLGGISAIGVDEVQWQRGHCYLTLVYQIDTHCKRLLWVGKERKVKTLLGFFRWFGPERSGALKFVCSDMWKPYLRVIAKKAGQAVHVLDRFHIMAHLSKAIDEVRAQEAKALKAKGYEPVLKDSRWLLLKRPERLSEKQETRLAELLQYNLRTVRAYLLKEDFQFFWGYRSWYWAGQFLERWCKRTMRSRLEPMKKVARMLRAHRPLILNWFRAKGAISSGIVEGFNNKAKLSIRKAYGFRTFHGMEIALLHALGALPEPQGTHRFC